MPMITGGRKGVERSGKIRIAFPFTYDAVGGNHISALNLIRHLDRARFDPVVLLDNAQGRVAELFRTEAIPFEPITEAPPLPDEALGVSASAGAMARYGISRVSALARRIRRQRIAIVHSNDGRMHVFGGLAARLSGARHVWHHRSDPDSFGFRHLAPALADHVVTVSRFVGPRPGWWSTAKRWTVVPSPFDTEAAPQDRAACRARLLGELEAPADAAIIGFFANFTERKRPLAFVRAIAALKAGKPGRPLAAPMFGKPFDIDEEDVRRLAAELGVADIVRPMGFRYPPEPLLAGCDVLLVTSVREPFGRTLIEAMLLKTLVVAVDSGGNPEAIEDRVNGHLVPADDASAAALRLAEIVRQPGAADTIVARARDDALSRFGMERHAQSIMRIYEQLLESPGRPESISSEAGSGARG